MTDRLTRARHYVEIDRPQAAQRILAEILEEDPEHFAALLLATEAAIDLEDFDRAQHLLERLTSLDPSSVEALSIRYRLHRSRDENVEAERTLLQILYAYPEHAFWIAEYALLMLEHFQFEKAEALAVEALRLDPEENRARFVTVLIATMNGDRDLTDETLAALLQNDPESLQTSIAVLNVLVDRNRYAEALRIAQQLLRTLPRNEEIRDSVIELSVYTHWFAKPAWPMYRWGWGAAIAIYFLALIGLRVLAQILPPGVFLAVALTYFAWVVHSWVHRPILRSWIRRRGV